MSAHIKVIQAVGAEFLRRKFRGFVILYGALCAASIGLMIWVSTQGEWWWVLAAVMVPVLALGLIGVLIARWILNRLRPAMTKVQRQSTKDFVDKLERVTEHIQMPMFMIFIRVVLDILRPGKQTFIGTVAHDSSSLRTDFVALRNLFD